MPDRRLRCEEWTLFDDRGVHRAPADILAVGNQTIPVSCGTTVRLINSENGVVGEGHGVTSDFKRSMEICPQHTPTLHLDQVLTVMILFIRVHFFASHSRYLQITFRQS